MKLLLLSDINSPHTQKWAIELAKKGLQVAVFSISQPVADWYSEHNIQLLDSLSRSHLSKMGYIKLLPKLKTAITQFKPDLIHAHYATSYGLLGALCKAHPFVISVWGSDVMEFPNKSWLHKKIVKYNLSKADSVWATSEMLVMALKKLCNKNIHKIPFGIDTNYFKPTNVKGIFESSDIVIGTVKSLEKIYGIDILLNAFKKISGNNPSLPLKLIIVGGGSKDEEYKTLAKKLDIADKTFFTGKIEYAKVTKYHNMIDIFINVSRDESFGVSVLESSACEKPVIVSNVGGLKEVVKNGDTGFLIEINNVDNLVSAIEKLVNNKDLREEMGRKGRVWVQQKFDLNNNVDEAVTIYKQLLAKN